MNPKLLAVIIMVGAAAVAVAASFVKDPVCSASLYTGAGALIGWLLKSPIVGSEPK